MSDEHPIRDLLPGFSLGILEKNERDSVREHLAGCSSCRAELAAYREVTGRLAAAAPDYAPPAGLEDRIMRSLPPRAAPARSGAAPARVDRVSARRRSAPWPALTGIAAALAVALGAGNVLQWNRVIPGSGAVGSPMPAAPAASTGAAGQIKLVTAVLTGTAHAREAYGTIVLDPADNKGVLAVTGLPGLDPAHQYQLWLIRNGERRSGGVFTPDSEGYGSLLLIVPSDFRDFRSFGVSVEPRGGSPVPTGNPVMTGSL